MKLTTTSGKSRISGWITFVIFVSSSGLSMSAAAHAEDHGSWQNSCNTGRTCFPTFNTWPACTTNSGNYRLSSPVRDSYFPNDYYSNGGTLNDNSGCMWNRNTVNVRAYAGANYDSSINSTSCIAAGGSSVGPFPKGVAAGMSSFKSC